MFRFHASDFATILADIGQGIAALQSTSGVTDAAAREKLEKVIANAIRDCREVGLVPVVLSLERLAARIEQGEGRRILAIRLEEIELRVMDEADQYLIFAIAPTERHIYETVQLPERVFSKIPSARLDMEEAGKCFALDRTTACVFHLMRVVEAGLLSIFNATGQPMPKIKNWETLLKECAAAGVDQEVISDLRSIKTAWRNPVMHVEKTYSKQLAADIFSAVSTFMRGIVPPESDDAS